MAARPPACQTVPPLPRAVLPRLIRMWRSRLRAFPSRLASLASCLPGILAAVLMSLLCAPALADAAAANQVTNPATGVATKRNAPRISIGNQTQQELLNIRLRSGLTIVFLRLDLAPGRRDEVENPGGVADMRVDTGLELWFFRQIPLDSTRRMTFCGDHGACLILEQTDGISRHVPGSVTALVPGPGSTPVCELARFRPGMTMSDVCSILSADAPRDDNDAILEGLGFAGMLWAARLIPGHDEDGDGTQGAPGRERLEHLELRRPLDAADLNRLLDTLYAQGYTPWQAELPGLDMDFAEMPGISGEQCRELLAGHLKRFLDAGHGEASIMLAPAAELEALADADAPREDVQLFTISLRPDTRMLLVDVAAYRGVDGR